MSANLFETMQNFWTYWLGDSLAGTETLNLVAFASTIFFVYFVIFYPLVRLVRGRKKDK